jgi:hypothetical protein
VYICVCVVRASSAHLSRCPAWCCHGRAISEGAALCTFVCAWCGRVARTCRAVPRGAVTGERSPKELPCVRLYICVCVVRAVGWMGNVHAVHA